jgi:hypothetical protein
MLSALRTCRCACDDLIADIEQLIFIIERVTLVSLPGEPVSLVEALVCEGDTVSDFVDEMDEFVGEVNDKAEHFMSSRNDASRCRCASLSRS